MRKQSTAQRSPLTHTQVNSHYCHNWSNHSFSHQVYYAKPN